MVVGSQYRVAAESLRFSIPTFDQSTANCSLGRWLARCSFKEIAKANGVSEQYVGKLILLAFLAPDIVEKIASGGQPEDLSAEDLTKRIELPHSWEDQQALLGLG